jgi:hypothetical protein
MKLWKIAAKPRYYGVEDPDAGMYHDYNAEWDYEVVNRPRGKMMQAFILAAQNIQNKHMDLFKDYFKRFSIQFVKDVGGLASYISGTSGEPVIAVNLRVCANVQRECRNEFTMYQTAITTLMHELKHAMQDSEERLAVGTPEESPDEWKALEDEAEDFGMRFMY